MTTRRDDKTMERVGEVLAAYPLLGTGPEELVSGASFPGESSLVPQGAQANASDAKRSPDEGGNGDSRPAALSIVERLPEWGVGEGWLAEYERMAVRIAKSTALPDSYNADARNVLAIALAGRELGIGFMEATRSIDIIKGATALRAELKMALARRAGLIVDEVIETETSCTIKAHRSDTGETGEGTFNEADKKKARLGLKDDSAWNTYPKDMYWARAATRLLRRLMPDARGSSFRSVEEVSE